MEEQRKQMGTHTQTKTTPLLLHDLSLFVSHDQVHVTLPFLQLLQNCTFLSHFLPLLSSSPPLLLDQVSSKLQALKSSTFVNMNMYTKGPSLPLHVGSEAPHFKHETALSVKMRLQQLCYECIQNRKYSEIISLPVSSWWLPCILLDRPKACRQRGSWRIWVNQTAGKGAW